MVCNCMVPGSALGGILAFLLLCAGLPSFVNNNNHNNNNNSNNNNSNNNNNNIIIIIFETS